LEEAEWPSFRGSEVLCAGLSELVVSTWHA